MSNPCSSCGSTTGLSYTITTNSCASTSTSTDASSITYTGPAMSCLEIETNTDLQTILEAINTKVCVEGGNWDFDFACLPTLCECTINSAQTFAEAISEQFCTLNTTYTTFIGDYDGTFPVYQTVVDNRFNDVENPDLTISCASITGTDNLWAVLSKLGTKLCNINTTITTGISNCDWSQCLTVTSPGTLNEAFDQIIDWVCDINNTLENISELPTFNNIETCIDGISPLIPATSSDSLYNTVLAIRNSLCTKPDYDFEVLETSCLSVGSTLQTALQAIVDAVDNLKQNEIYDVTGNGITRVPVDSENPCSGYTLNFDPEFYDSKVAVDASQTPGYLYEKLTAGTGIIITKTGSTPDKIVEIASTVTDTKEVKVESGGSEGYLLDKITVADSIDGVIAFTKGNVGDTVQISAGIDYEQLTSKILTTLIDNSTLNSIFCENLVCNCNCDSPEPTSSRLIKVYLSGENLEVGEQVLYTLQVSQMTNPTVLFNGSGNMYNGDFVDSGYSQITDITLNPQGSIVLTNNDSNDLYYWIYTTLSDGTTYTNNQSGYPYGLFGSISASNSEVFSPYPPYGNGYYFGEMASGTSNILHIKLSRRTFD